MDAEQMLREIDRRRPAPRRGFAVTLISAAGISAAGLLLGAGLTAHAEDASVAAEPGDKAVIQQNDAGTAATPNQPPAAIGLPLPPYPPPVSGLEAHSDDKPFAGAVAEARAEREAASFMAVAKPEAAPQPQPEAHVAAASPAAPAASPPQAASPEHAPPAAAAAPAAPPVAASETPAAAKAAELPAAAPASTPDAASAPQAAPAIAADDHAPEDHTADIMQAAFTKETAGPLPARLGNAERQALIAYFDKRAFRPIWHVDGALTPAALAVLDRLAHAAEEGLDPDDYVAAATASAVTAPTSTHPDDIADAEWRISAAALAYARDARGARVTPSRLSNLITPSLALPDAETVLDTLTRAQDASAALAAFNPHADGYVNLRTALGKLRAEMVAPSPAAAPGKAQRTVGAELASVAPETMKGRRGTPLDQAAKRAVSAVSAKRVEADIIANMERWRWLPPELGDRYILVNVPEYTLRYVNNGVVAHQARVIVGKPTSPTPIFSAEMKFLVVNPSWYIPPSILKKEFLPKLANDPLFAERQGYVVAYHGGQISIRQPPGERNALGRIKFMFPNEHSVYLHDTPTRGLFASTSRAFSHGCVRVDQPFKLAEYVLNNQASWPEKRIEKMIGGSERTINLPAQLPVHLAYFTLSADANGNLQRFGDIYGMDTRLEAVLAPRK